MKNSRKHYTPEEKVAILRRHLLEKEPISKLCDELGLQPTVFYRWQKEFFENGAAAFEQKGGGQTHSDSINPAGTPTAGGCAASGKGYVGHYNNVRLNSAMATSRRRTCSPGVSRRSTRGATGTWRRRGSNGRFVASKPLDVQLMLVGRGSG